ncbi:uncharacterized protein LOC127796653 isoform X2 [Diospyros lotus]|uniref:uncharacterized protein LOC127796653 isoform X2 n=1 Tax=Diospyros lotus TaxID=55363 RepID=UPI00225B6353|nr:uncharacterized protein LOC127796653 isoform X2 [Diospyros lotus]
MDDVFGEILGCGLGSDSVMLRLLRSAMDEAHENVQCTDGPVELLNARSKFYELAMILVLGCSKLIEEKTDIPECNRDKMLSDLRESEDVVRGRLHELKLGIVNKDRELTSRLENESRLRQALESRERELASLQARFELERKKSEELLIDQAIGDQGKEGCICELKNSVDQQVWNIKQKLEGGNGNEAYAKEALEETPAEQNVVIEQMSSDIDCLKGTVDLAFGRMQNAEARPLEKQWRWRIEKDTIFIIIRGFLSSLQHRFEAELGKRASDRQASSGFFPGHSWVQFIDQITRLHRELKALCSQNGVPAGNNSSETLSNIRRTSSEPLPELGNYEEEEQHEEDQDGNGNGDGSHFVATMIKNHESIIRMQRKELNLSKREVLKESSSIKKLNHSSSTKRRLENVISRLDNVIKWNAKAGDFKALNRTVSSRGKEKATANSLASFDDQKVGDSSVSYMRQVDLDNETRRLKQESRDLKLQAMIVEDIYVTLSKGLMKDLELELYNYEAENRIKDDICMLILKEMLKESNISSETRFNQRQADGEQVCCTVCNKTIRDFCCSHGFRSAVSQNDGAEVHMEELAQSRTRSLLNYLRSRLNEDVSGELFKEVIQELRNGMDCHVSGNLIKEETYQILVDEMVKFREPGDNSPLSQHQPVRVPENYTGTEAIESALREEICMVFFREMIGEWNTERDAYDFENFVRGEIYHLIHTEALKDALNSLAESEAQNKENYAEESLLSSKKSDGSLDFFGEESLIRKLDSLSRHFEVQEDLMLEASSEIKEHSLNNDLVASECEEVDERAAIEWLLTEEETTFSSVSNKLQEALQQFSTSKELLRELLDSLGIAVSYTTGKLQDQIIDHPVLDIADHREASVSQPDDDKILQLIPFNPILSSLAGFQQLLVGFECMVHQQLGISSLRLKELENQIDPLIRFVATLRQRELLYRKAFLTRCHNLRLAETEFKFLQLGIG